LIQPEARPYFSRAASDVTKELLSRERILFAMNCEIAGWIVLRVIVLALSITTNTN
jgi:hypothetical protein